MYTTVTGQGGISATIIQDSINFDSYRKTRITTFELTYPRFIHSEFMTHGMLAKNAASSRAIPVDKMIELVLSHPQAPIHWGKNQSGMQAKEELVGEALANTMTLWDEARTEAVFLAKEMLANGAHKQIANRILEPFTQMKVVCTATEYENFFWLRDHPDAQPEIQELARCMRAALENSKPLDLYCGEWHVPYVSRDRDIRSNALVYHTGEGSVLTLDEAKIVSASCCAQVSYRKSDDTVDKAQRVYDRLIGSEPVHASPTEHQAMAIYSWYTMDDEIPGVTHQTINGDLWSAKFRNWVQHRQLIPNHSKMEI